MFFLSWSNVLNTFFERHCDTDLPYIANIQTWWAGSCMTHIKKIQSSKLFAAFKENFFDKENLVDIYDVEVEEKFLDECVLTDKAPE